MSLEEFHKNENELFLWDERKKEIVLSFSFMGGHSIQIRLKMYILLYD